MADQEHIKSLCRQYGKAATDKKRATEVREEFRRLATSTFPL